jgi:hypothetical protein
VVWGHEVAGSIPVTRTEEKGEPMEFIISWLRGGLNHTMTFHYLDHAERFEEELRQCGIRPFMSVFPVECFMPIGTEFWTEDE